ncbi:MAG: Holliday junction resolvase RuvX [Desulfovibrionaceae bacterium]|nr:Holliday junction resolvase RuvX [Desulfovibrionaceae bacterium]
MKFLAIDYGQKRTGIALSDPGGVLAFPRATIIMRGKDAFFAELLALAEAEAAQAFVVGLPLRENGEDSETTRQARNMAARLKRRTKLPVYFMPEALSSHDAESRLRAAGKNSDTIRHTLDKAAAAAILESFLALPEDRRMPA